MELFLLFTSYRPRQNLILSILYQIILCLTAGVITLALIFVLGAVGAIALHTLSMIGGWLILHAIPLLADPFPFIEQVFWIHFVIQPALLLLGKFRSLHVKNALTEMSSILQVLIPGAILVLSEVYWMVGMLHEEIYLRHANLPVPEWELSAFFFTSVSACLTLFYLALLEDAHGQPFSNIDPA